MSIDDCRWKVQSESEPGKWYVVEKAVDKISCDCHLRCDACNICMHTYSCTCLNASLHNTICKHVHLHCLQFNFCPHAMLETSTSHFSQVELATLCTDVSTIITSAGPGSIVPKSMHNISKETVLRKIDKLKDLVSNSYVQNLSEVNSHLSSAIALLRSTQPQEFVVKKRPAPNSNSITQEAFFSTRKKRKVTCNQIKKPSNDESSSIHSRLSQIDSKMCGIGFDVDDDHCDAVVKWIECDECFRWFHNSCVKRSTLLSMIDEDNFQCCACTSSN